MTQLGVFFTSLSAEVTVTLFHKWRPAWISPPSTILVPIRVIADHRHRGERQLDKKVPRYFTPPAPLSTLNCFHATASSFFTPRFLTQPVFATKNCHAAIIMITFFIIIVIITMNKIATDTISRVIVITFFVKIVINSLSL